MDAQMNDKVITAPRSIVKFPNIGNELCHYEAGSQQFTLKLCRKLQQDQQNQPSLVSLSFKKVVRLDRHQAKSVHRINHFCLSKKDLECKVAEVLDALNVDCLPEAVYRLGKYNEKGKRLIKVVLPSMKRFAIALANAHKLRGTALSNIYVRENMTAAERAKDFELLQEALQRNQNKATKEWIPYVQIHAISLAQNG
ncbi:hypothetical protein OESDEN_00889 [Oesophagostomum dentatum]|uniref:Uncharacterized protein n=1 Tax=Oesophagostomum dentatum TaxID=61180 RepID=A0A0B1TSP6_OESDE|nr:hypothetical protein OESDEN_00889 [Oesophagostomum dentatum]